MRRRKRRIGTKQEALRNEYRRVRRNALQRINRLKRQGYVVNIDIPSIPKRITEGSIRNIENKLSSKKVQEGSYWFSTEIGVIIPGTQRKEILRQIKEDVEVWKKRDKGEGTGSDVVEEEIDYGGSGGSGVVLDEAAGKVVVDNLLYEFSKLNQEKAYGIFREWISGWVHSMGFSFVGTTLERAARTGIVITVTEEDSGPKAVAKTKDYIYRVMDLSGEYEKDTIVDIINNLDYI